MEDSFRVRVDKVFGSLTGSNSADNQPVPTPAPLRSFWSLTDEEVERSRWRKDVSNGAADEEDDDTESLSLSRGFLAGKEPKPAPSRSDASFRRHIETDLDDLDDQDQDEDDDEKKSFDQRPDDYNEEEWEIKNCIGRDCTLDFEDEEDQYDKVAVGREKYADRVFLKDLSKNEYEIDTGPSSSLEEALARDHRANHNAAKLRLKEDDESAAQKIDSLTVSDHDSPQLANSYHQDANLKSILKRKDEQVVDDSKSQKRVRFDPECMSDEKETEDTAMEADSEDPLVYRMPVDYPSGIPDYMRNPSKYTKYTFESSDVDEGTNRQAYMDFLKLIKKSEPGPEVDESLRGDPPKSVPFVPRKKENNGADLKNKQGEDGSGKKGVNVVIAAADDMAGSEESCAMDEDEPEAGADRQNGGSGRPGRRYRMKGKLEVDE